MSTPLDGLAADETACITVRYWASARAAAGVTSDELPVSGPLTLSDVVRRAVALHPGSRLPNVLEAQRNARDVLAQYVADLADAWIATAGLRVLTLTTSSALP